MDPRDHQRALPDGLVCTVCNEPVPVDQIRFLASRDDLMFIQVTCGRCGSTALEFVADLPPGPDESVHVGPNSHEPISSDDVLAVHELLAGWQGDLRTLLASLRGATGSDGGTRR